MKNALGLLGIVVFIVCVIGLAATMTWLVVKLGPVLSRFRSALPDR
jgi:hypothetical protein